MLLWDAGTQKLRKPLALPLIRSSSQDLSFVPGTHDLLANTPDGVVVVNADTGQSRLIRRATPPFETRVSGNGRRLLIEQPGREADLWMMEIRE